MKKRLNEDLENIVGAMSAMDCYAIDIWQNRIIRVMLHAIHTLLVWAIRGETDKAERRANDEQIH